MIDAGLRFLHVLWWIPFIVWFGLYAIWAFSAVVNGYGQEYMGWRHPGRPGKIHKILVRFHTGAHMHPDRSYGDEVGRSRIAGGGRGAVYYVGSRRWQRALRNNGIVFCILVILSSMVAWPAITVRLITIAVILGLALWAVLLVRRARRRAARRRPVSRPALARTIRAKAVLEADTTTLGARPKLAIEARPVLDGVPAATLAPLLAAQMDCSSAEVIARMALTPDEGRMVLPDAYPALQKSRDVIEEIINSHNKGKVSFAWTTTAAPRTLVWTPIVEHVLPKVVRFRDYLDKLEALGPRELGVGVRADRTMYVASHNGDFPLHCRFAGPGTGKTTGFQVKAAQILHRDPKAELYCIDTKQVSFAMLRDIPGVHIYDDPMDNMDMIWQVFYELYGIMRSRYKSVKSGELTWADLNDLWVLVDEGNDLAASFKSYSKKKDLGATAPIWTEVVGPLMRMGRESRIFQEWMFQDLDGRMFGGEPLKNAFNAFGAAGFLPQQFARTVGNPAEECMEGPGRILMCRGNKREWVQGFFDDENWLHEYALANRKG